MAIELKEHQTKVVEDLHNGAVLWGDVGGGKTIASLAYYYIKVCGGVLNEGPVRPAPDIYVITTAKKRDSLDWVTDAAKLGISTDGELSFAGKITVDSWNNIEKYDDVTDAFFVFDEQRVVGSGTWTKSFIKIAKSNQWILLSATPGDTWMDYIPVFLANGFYKNRTEFKNRHVIYKPFKKFPQIDRYIDVGTLVRHRNSILVEMPFERHTVRHIEDVLVDYDKDLMEKVMTKRWHVYEERPLRDVSELFSVMRRVANSDVSRVQQVQELLKKHPRLIVFYNFDYELEMLRCLQRRSVAQYRFSNETDSTSTLVSGMGPIPGQMLKPSPGPMLKASSVSSYTKGSGTGSLPTAGSKRSLTSEGQAATDLSVSSSKTITAVLEPEIDEFWLPDEGDGETLALAEWNGHKHQPIPADQKWVYLVQYAAGSEGWNCTETNAMVFFSQTYSYKHLYQGMGRIDRLNTPFVDLYYYHLVSKAPIDVAIKRALRSKKSFNESAFRVNI